MRLASTESIPRHTSDPSAIIAGSILRSRLLILSAVCREGNRKYSHLAGSRTLNCITHYVLTISAPLLPQHFLNQPTLYGNFQLTHTTYWGKIATVLHAHGEMKILGHAGLGWRDFWVRAAFQRPASGGVAQRSASLGIRGTVTGRTENLESGRLLSGRPQVRILPPPPFFSHIAFVSATTKNSTIISDASSSRNVYSGTTLPVAVWCRHHTTHCACTKLYESREKLLSLNLASALYLLYKTVQCWANRNSRTAVFHSKKIPSRGSAAMTQSSFGFLLSTRAMFAFIRTVGSGKSLMSIS